jgi:hypothetical protein
MARRSKRPAESAKWVSIKTSRLTLEISGKVAFFKHLWDGNETF